MFCLCVFQYDAEMERRLQEQKRHEQHQQQNQTNEYREPKISNVPAGLQNGQVGDLLENGQAGITGSKPGL